MSFLSVIQENRLIIDVLSDAPRIDYSYELNPEIDLLRSKGLLVTKFTEHGFPLEICITFEGIDWVEALEIKGSDHINNLETDKKVKMKKFEIGAAVTIAGVVVTLIISIVSGSNYIGELEGRVKSLEQDKDYSSIKEEKEKVISEIKTVGKSQNENMSKIKTSLSKEIDKDRRDRQSAIAQIRDSIENSKISFFNLGRVSKKAIGKHDFCALSKIQSDFNTTVGNTFQWIDRDKNGNWTYRSSGHVSDQGGVVCIDFK